MPEKLILRLSNELGNQMFMYASAYSISKKINRKMYIDDETAYLNKKNVSKYCLDSFFITSPVAPDKLKFKELSGYIKRKLLIKSDFLRSKKYFYIEKKDINKITEYYENYKNIQFNENLFLEGHFETEKYFLEHADDIKKEFEIKNSEVCKKNIFFKDIIKENSVAICLRQNRFIEGIGQNTKHNREKSWKFTLEQINYINKSAEIIKSKIPNPKFFLWSNDFTNIDKNKFNFDFKTVNLNNEKDEMDVRVKSLYLLIQCNHFIVTCSTFNWWGAWLSERKNKIVLRPSKDNFTNFTLNNKNFWPLNWSKVNA